ncbi:VanZ family protein [Actinoplanes sp. LDG1-06]|uniref:VanZ family protein n=1 Tax=Paractinoplanes ovalisporus TaxID=2810368 RepID=A0ABS2AU89_9ACTN|nr:VanZ family protein [Actinoplanes ovalisporus]MBM2623305.1 VanZ family protein [Actinoplanes ovalisporus]
MPSGQLEVPALPILIPLGTTIMVVTVVVLLRLRALAPGRLIAMWAAGWYAVAVLGATMLPLDIAWGPEAGSPELYRFLLVPFVTMRVDDFLLNVIMLVPLAAALRVVAGVRDRRRVVLTGFLISLTIETTQGLLLFFLHGNRWADTNDLIANTLGAWLGWVIIQAPAAARALDRWSVARRPEPLPHP